MKEIIDIFEYDYVVNFFCPLGLWFIFECYILGMES